MNDIHIPIQGEMIRFRSKYGYIPFFGDPHLDEMFKDSQRLIGYFEEAIKIWFEKFISLSTRMMLYDPDYGVGILAVLNPIPEMLGKLISDKYPQMEGFKYIFPTLEEKTILLLREELRNSISHNYMTKGTTIMLSQNFNTHLEVKEDIVKRGEKYIQLCWIQINPPLLAFEYKIAIQRYISELYQDIEKDGETDKIRRFRRYLCTPTPRGCGLPANFGGYYYKCKCTSNEKKKYQCKCRNKGENIQEFLQFEILPCYNEVTDKQCKKCKWKWHRLTNTHNFPKTRRHGLEIK